MEASHWQWRGIKEVEGEENMLNILHCYSVPKPPHLINP